jgi:hypothetical protein
VIEKLPITLAVALLYGCSNINSVPTKPVEASGNFQLHTATDGRVYRIDKSTGLTTWLDGANYRPVVESGMPQLVAGKVYRGEDGATTYRYQGAGKLEKWGLDKYFNNPQQGNPTQK